MDGFIADEDGDVDWLLGEDEYDFESFMDRVDTILMGYTTYVQSVGFGKWPYEGRECYVFTEKHPDTVDDRVIFSPDPLEVTKKLLREDGKAIWVLGGSSIVSLFLNNSLISEFRIAIQPIVLGKGIPLFRDITKRIKLDLTGTQAYSSGLVELVYKVKIISDQEECYVK